MIVHQGYQIKPDKKNPSSVLIVTDGRGGKIPNALDGLFTSVTIAKEAVDAYLASKPTKGVKNDAEAVSEG